MTGNNSGLSLPDDISNLPFDMPKLGRRKQLLDQVILIFHFQGRYTRSKKCFLIIY